MPLNERHDFGPVRFAVRTAAFAVLAAGAAAAAAQNSYSLATQDGLSLTLSTSGSVSALAVNGADVTTPTLPSGFAYRELPPSASDSAPNGSFESGSSRPDAWSWTNGGGGSWSWVSDTAS